MAGLGWGAGLFFKEDYSVVLLIACVHDTRATPLRSHSTRTRAQAVLRPPRAVPLT